MTRALAAAALVLCACSADDGSPRGGACDTSDDCATGEMCIDRTCIRTAVDAGRDAGADGPPVCACAAGEVCAGAACVADCGDPAAEPCAAGTTCDFATARCVADGTPGLLTGDDEACGDATCRPGTECSVDGRCEVAPGCGRITCTDDGSVCWGGSCPAERPPGGCEVAPIERLNMDDFLLGGDGGAFDLDVDDACNAYAVTMISGTDYLRQVAPDGTLTVWNGVTNLNMGEVAALRVPGDEFGTGDGPGEVGLTYICCASCGCISADRQGVARLDRAGASSLPMVIEAIPTDGSGPWGMPTIDTGPYGLTWGRDRTLYVGNVMTNGDLVRADLVAGTSGEIHRFDARITATAPFGARSLLVALEGGALVVASVDTAATRPFADAGAHVTSLVRDPFTGDVFAALATGRIARFDRHGTALPDLATPAAAVRIAYAPDGYLYALDPGWPRPGAVTRIALPTTR